MVSMYKYLCVKPDETMEFKEFSKVLTDPHGIVLSNIIVKFINFKDLNYNSYRVVWGHNNC